MPLNNFGLCGPFGRCAQPDADGFIVAIALGYTQILKLNTDDEFSDTEEIYQFTTGTIWHVPMNSFNPDEQQVRALVKELQLVPPTEKLLIHCTHGRDRTGLVCAAYRILVEHWTVERAWEEMKLFGWTPISSLTDHAIHECLERLAT